MYLCWTSTLNLQSCAPVQTSSVSGGGSSMKLEGLIAQLDTAEGSGTEAHSADQFTRSVEIFFAFSYQDGLSWHLRPWETSQGRVFFWAHLVPWASYGYCIAIARVLKFSNNPFLTIQNNPFLSGLLVDVPVE